MLKAVILVALAVAAAARKCHNVTVPISISSRNAVFDLEAPTTDIAATNFALDLTRQGSNSTDKLLKGYKTVHGDYEIAATYCEPDRGPGHALQILTHGIGFDRSYWDQPLHNYNYSYVAHAVDKQGCSTFSWDRLGVGRSSKGEPVNEIQSFLEIAALKALTTALRAGGICGIGATYGKTVHVGHSFGSVITYNLVNEDPDITDAIVLTGFSHTSDYIAYFGLGGNFAPVKEIETLAPDYPDGYLAPRTGTGVHINFFAPGDFDPEMLAVAAQTGQAVAPGELLTVVSGAGEPNVFEGPVLVITGEFDIPFCGGDCKATSSIQGAFPDLIAASSKYFANASVFNSTVVPGAGHGLNYGYSSKSAYASILHFIEANL